MKRQRLETVETLAERFGLPRRTIEREVKRCRLPYVSIAGNLRFRERDIELWLERAGGLPRLHTLHPIVDQAWTSWGSHVESSIRVETVATLALRLEMTRDALVREVVEGRLPYVSVGGHWRFREMDIAYWQKNHGGDAGLKLVGEHDSG